MLKRMYGTEYSAMDARTAMIRVDTKLQEHIETEGFRMAS